MDTEGQNGMPTCGACEKLGLYFDKSGKFWYAGGKDGSVIPILYCPVCGKKIQYGKE